MKSDRQRGVMDDFRAGRIDVLAATTVVEVGLDVPEATVMLIESADRFGLAQLHQLRGRIGRGSRPGRCLIVSDLDPADAPRLEIMARTGDGFVLAEEDLKMRGPGDVAGVRQSGLPSLNWAALPKDIDRLLQARDLAEKVLDRDPELNDPAFKLVREVVGQVEEDIQFEAERSG
jgi:ATP-dependent DNA helicase RecG